MKTDGIHVVADIWLDETISLKNVKDAALCGLKKSKMNIVSDLDHNFGGDAFTALWLLSESHFSIHYFPERAYIAADCFTCGEEGSAQDAIFSFISALPCVKKSKIKTFCRG